MPFTMPESVEIANNIQDCPEKGWRRIMIQRKSGKSAGKWDVYYVTPEGKRLRSQREVARYLKNNEIELSVELFNFKKNASRQKECVFTKVKPSSVYFSQYFSKESVLVNTQTSKDATSICVYMGDKKKSGNEWGSTHKASCSTVIENYTHKASCKDNMERQDTMIPVGPSWFNESFYSTTAVGSFQKNDSHDVVSNDCSCDGSVSVASQTNTNRGLISSPMAQGSYVGKDPMDVAKNTVTFSETQEENKFIELDRTDTKETEVSQFSSSRYLNPVSNPTKYGEKIESDLIQRSLHVDVREDIRTSPYFRKKECSLVEEHDGQPKEMMSVDYECLPPGLKKFHQVKYVPPRSPFNLIQEDLYHDPWKLLVATIFLNKTSGRNAVPMLWKFFECFPNAQKTSKADPAEIAKIIQPLGLFRKRSEILVRFSSEFLTKMWHHPVELYGIGKYGNDSFLIFCHGRYKDIFPDDSKLNLYHSWLCERDRENGGSTCSLKYTIIQ